MQSTPPSARRRSTIAIVIGVLAMLNVAGTAAAEDAPTEPPPLVPSAAVVPEPGAATLPPAPSPWTPGAAIDWASPAAAPEWQPPQPEPLGMNDEAMFYISAALLAAGCALMTPALLRLDLAGDPHSLSGATGTLATVAAGGAGYAIYLTTTPLVLTGALPRLRPDERRRSDAALSAGIILTMTGAMATPPAVFFLATAARGADPDDNLGRGAALAVAAAVGLAAGVPLTVWGAAPGPKQARAGPGMVELRF